MAGEFELSKDDRRHLEKISQIMGVPISIALRELAKLQSITKELPAFKEEIDRRVIFLDEHLASFESIINQLLKMGVPIEVKPLIIDKQNAERIKYHIEGEMLEWYAHLSVEVLNGQLMYFDVRPNKRNIDQYLEAVDLAWEVYGRTRPLPVEEEFTTYEKSPIERRQFGSMIIGHDKAADLILWIDNHLLEALKKIQMLVSKRGYSEYEKAIFGYRWREEKPQYPKVYFKFKPFQATEKASPAWGLQVYDYESGKLLATYYFDSHFALTAFAEAMIKGYLYLLEEA